ncbi:hypothetical protein SB6411_02903 [Klebsiella spallanzanii]|uniref:Uncharacterized protein n=1 Tax=Klebsiella spallanzanii TaxID=2587528 RepID=A0ABY6VIE8_9ENTR|nr:hypothetical protein SB6411_02903 [Klebsiella spallanzanii]
MRNSKQKEERKLVEYLRCSENNEDLKNTREWY